MFWIPTGTDRADGENPLPSQPADSMGDNKVMGTPSPDGELFLYGSKDIEEASDSPEIERAEQATLNHNFTTDYDKAVAYLLSMGRGTFLRDSWGGLWRVLSSKLKAMKPGLASFSYVAESISFDTPPDDFSITPEHLGIDIIKHPRYFYALYPSGSDFVDLVGIAPNRIPRAQVKFAIIRAIQTYRDSPYFPQQERITVNGVVQNNIIANFIASIVPSPSGSGSSEVDVNVSGDTSCLMAIAAANEIIQKLWYQIDAPPLVGFKIQWTQYFFAETFLSPGGYIENPVGWIPEYFMAAYNGTLQSVLPRSDIDGGTSNQDTVPPLSGGAASIFDRMAVVNPQCYSSNGASNGGVNISWLRESDEVIYERTWFKVIHTWIGSPIGHWDRQLFSQFDRPNLGNYNDSTFGGAYLPMGLPYSPQ